jgi:hypothetical protein
MSTRRAARRLPVDEKLALMARDPRLRARELLQRDRSTLLANGARALRQNRLRQRAELLLNPAAVTHRNVERASARRQVLTEIRAKAWWSELTGDPDAFRG